MELLSGYSFLFLFFFFFEICMALPLQGLQFAFAFSRALSWLDVIADEGMTHIHL
jgi:hypothetical protein